ncbi:MAG: DUF2306 domain-containing protein [Blastocatellia bacterium]|nr:DUF2306 domain-containing protein [Blastocatellia bacterium]
MQTALWSAVVLLVIIGAAVVIRRAIHLIPILFNGYHPPTTAASTAFSQFAGLDDIFARYPILTLVHIFPALVFLVLAPLQFSRTFRERHLHMHRVNGRILLICGMITGGSALLMSFVMPAIGGVNQAAATTLFAIIFLFSLGKAFSLIKRGEVARHREWMIRAFSTALAVATIRPIIAVFFATSRFSGLTPYEFFGTGFWIGFVLHLIAAEVWIGRTRV